MKTLKSMELEYKKKQADVFLSKIENANRYYADNKQEIFDELGKCFNDPIARVFNFPSYAEYNEAGNKFPDNYALNVIRKAEEVKGYELVANKSRTIYGEEVLVGTFRKAPRKAWYDLTLLDFSLSALVLITLLILWGVLLILWGVSIWFN